MTDNPREWLDLLGSVIRRAIHTMLALQDPDRHFIYQGTAGWIIPTVPEWISYGNRKWPFVPLPEDISKAEIVFGWLSWLGDSQGKRAVERLTEWAIATPTWVIAKQEQCTERTILNRIDRSLSAILGNFGGVEIDLPKLEERGVAAHWWSSGDKPVAGYSGRRQPLNASYVDGIGRVQNGSITRRQTRSKWQDGSEQRYPANPWNRSISTTTRRRSAAI